MSFKIRRNDNLLEKRLLVSYNISMPMDMKEQIARTTLELLKNGNLKKITVKDIVEACNITRQSFYYHFDGVPQLFDWIIRKRSDRLLSYSFSDDMEQGLRVFFISAVNALPYIRKGMQTNYRDEFERILSQAAYDLFDRMIEKNGYYSDYPLKDVAVIRRYHVQAVIGILREWSEKDTEDIDHIVHCVHLLLSGRMSV